MTIDYSFGIFDFFYFMIGITFALLGKWALELFQKKRSVISWKTFYRAFKKSNLFEKYEDPKKCPNIIIGLNNGIVPASIIATHCGVEDLKYFHMYPLLRKNGRRIPVKIIKKNLDLTNKKILIVDDQSYTGRSMHDLYNHLKTYKGFDTAKIEKFAVFEREYYGSKGDGADLTIDAPGKIKGAIKKIPWSFTKKHHDISTHQGEQD